LLTLGSCGLYSEKSFAPAEKVLAKCNLICYTTPVLRQAKGMSIVLTPELFWQLFEATGAISAYLMYKKLKS
jgi:hypothetical protein